MQVTARNWMTTTIAAVRNAYNAAPQAPPDLAEVMSVLNTLQASIATIGMPALPPPT